jgi:hypothetical protein
MDMVVLPGVLGCWLLRRTVQVRLGTNPLHAAQAPALRAVARWHAHLHGLATAIHEISGLGEVGGSKQCGYPLLVIRYSGVLSL